MATTKQASYQELREQLDEIMQQLQAEDLDVDTAIALYEQGQKLLVALDKRLQAAENHIKTLKQ